MSGAQLVRTWFGFLWRSSQGTLWFLVIASLLNAVLTAAFPWLWQFLIDAVGAGDAFTEALLVSQLECWPLVSSARFANQVGALVASKPGAMPVHCDEFAELKTKFSPAADSEH